ncbi:hypothetical protein FSP39_013849 [Pinctada imbricata]|uniref:Sulfotransferase domain-containing protein n=1 Tax=Pinctada imbricata TaxID=66713 RepID=A0AA89BJC4_PINIB|nr:hypothetical protein FSP39_013849 [Pinctada imbricata]
MLRIYDRQGKSMIAQKYDGMYFPYPLTDQGIGEHLSEMRNMASREDDVLITSYPKSGTHWLLEAVHMLMNNSVEYFRKDFPSPTGKSDGFPLLEYMLINKEIESLKPPRLMICHLKPKYIPQNFKGKIIHLTRNPKDVAVSYYTFIRKLKILEYEGEWNDFIPMFTKGDGMIFQICNTGSSIIIIIYHDNRRIKY